MCDLVFINPRPAPPLLEEFYQDPLYDCHQDSYAAEDARDANARLQLLEGYTARGSLLDYGCGAGALLATARERGWESVIGVEIGQGVREKLLSRGFTIFGTLDEAEQRHERVSAITMIHVLEHLVDPRSALDRAHRFLRPGGSLMVEVPNADSLRARLSASPVNRLLPRSGQRFQAYPIHLYYFNRGSLTQLLRSCGFEILTTRAIGLGVEEFFHRAAPAFDVEAQNQAGRGAHHHSTMTGELARRGKTAIKELMSSTHLGEHLLVVGRKVE